MLLYRKPFQQPPQGLITAPDPQVLGDPIQLLPMALGELYGLCVDLLAAGWDGVAGVWGGGHPGRLSPTEWGSTLDLLGVTLFSGPHEQGSQHP